MKNAQRLAFATALLTVVLIGVGVVVRATGSGLGCPNWPTCEGGALGGVVPPGHKHAMIEMSHRFTASLVGLMVIGTAALAWRHYRHAPVVLWTATIVVPLVGFQGILGAITVQRELPPEIVATHLLTAMVVLSLELLVAIGMWLEDPDARRRLIPAVRAPAIPIGRLAAVAIAWFAVTLWVGGYMAESGASTSCSGWPLCNGSVAPAADDQEITHMLHRYLAGALMFLLIPLIVAAWRRRAAVRWAGPVAVALAVLYVAQVAVGAFNVWYTFPDALTVSHTVLATLIWFSLSSAVVLAFYRPAAQAPVRASDGARVPA